MNSSGNIGGTVFPLLGITATPTVTPGSADILPPTIELTEGTVLRGVANGRTPEGATLIRTEIGDLSLNTDIFLKRGIEVAVQIERRQQDAFVRLVSIDGKSVPKYLEQQSSQAVSPDDTVQTSNMGAATRPSAPPSSAVMTPESVIPARVEAVLLTKLPLPPAPVSASPVATPPAAVPTTTAAPALPSTPLPVAPEMQPAFVQAAAGSRISLEVLAVNFPQTSTAAPATPVAATAPTAPTPSTPAPTAPMAPPAIAALPVFQTPVVPPSHPATLPVIGTPVTPIPGTPLAAPASMAPLAPGLAAYQKVAQTAPTPLPMNAPTIPVTTPTLTATAVMPAATPAASTTLQTPQAPLLPGAAESVQPPTAAVAASSANILKGPQPAPLPATPGFLTVNPPPVPLPATPAPSLLQAAPSLPGPPVFSAMVLGDSGPGELILQTPLGTLKLMNTAPLPPGAQLQVRVSEILPMMETDAADPLSSLAARGLKPEHWEALEEFAAMTAALPRQPGTGHIPSVGKQALTDVLFLLAALKGGDLRRFIGETRHKDMEITAPDLLARLGTDFSSLRGMSVEAREPQGWNMQTVPFFAGGQLEPIRFYHKRNRKDESRNSNGDSEHFLVDMFLSSFGHFQLDGLVKRAMPLQFDLIIRTDIPLGEAVEQDIRHIYHEAASVSGYQGSLLFRNGPKACVPPPVLPEGSASQDHSILV